MFKFFLKGKANKSNYSKIARKLKGKSILWVDDRL